MKLSEISIQRPVLRHRDEPGDPAASGSSRSRACRCASTPTSTRRSSRVTTFYRGASPQVVETEITDVLEEQLSTIEGVKLITSIVAASRSRASPSSSTSTATSTRRPTTCATASRACAAQLPRDADDPIVAKQDVNAQPIMWLSLNGKDCLDPRDVRRGRQRPLKDACSASRAWARCSSAPAAATPCACGSIPQRLAAHGLTVSDVERRPARRERRDPLRPRRGHGARVRGAHPRRPGDAGGVRAIVVAPQGDRPGAAGRRRQGRAGRRGRAHGGPLQRHPVGRPGHRQAAEGEHRGRGARRARGAARAARAAAAGHRSSKSPSTPRPSSRTSIHEVVVALVIAVVAGLRW